MLAYKISCTHLIPEEYFSQFNNVVRFAHNRISENPEAKLNEIEDIVKTRMNNIDLLDASFVKMAVNKSKSLTKERKITFAGKHFKNLKYGKGNKEDYLKAKNPNILIRGSKCDSGGNRKASLDLQNNKVFFKPARGIEYCIELSNDRRLSELKYLQSLCEVGEASFTLEIKRDSVSIITDETNLKALYKKHHYKPKTDRVLALDMNPNYIALAVRNSSNHIFYKEIIDLSQLNKISSKHKKLHETAEMTKRITELAIHYQCATVAFEELSIKARDHKKGKKFNKLVNNNWNRARFIQLLEKRCNLLSIKPLKIHAQYSSFVGCIQHENEYDSIAAALEIARRAISCNTTSTYKIFPDTKVSAIATRWKEMLGAEIENWSWNKLYDEFKKKPKLSYRNLFDLKKFKGFSFRLKSGSSGITCHEIPCFR